MSISSNLSIKSNLMIDDKNHKPETRYLPGDFVAQLYPGMVDKRLIESELTRRQKIEYEQYLICSICKKPCAGTCQGREK